jgi:hypothetical protein
MPVDHEDLGMLQVLQRLVADVHSSVHGYLRCI